MDAPEFETPEPDESYLHDLDETIEAPEITEDDLLPDDQGSEYVEKEVQDDGQD